MEYFIAFLEGIVTFISPCLLPMLPIYILYFAGSGKEQGRRRTLANAAGFVLGFTLVFVLLGAFAASIGRLLARHQQAVHLVTGLIVVAFGLNFAGFVQIPVLNRTVRLQKDLSGAGFWQSVLFGMIFSIGWTPCVGTFLGSALMLASSQGTVGKGVIMLLCYSMGLGLPFMVSAVFIDQLKGAFQWIKNHYGLINRVCGILLILVGVLMMTGYMNRLLTALSYA